jgi:hypothetical protein
MTRKRISDEQIIEAIEKAKNIKDALQLLGMAVCGSNYGTIYKCIILHKIDISHFEKPGFKNGHQPINELPDEKVFVINGRHNKIRLKARIIRKGLKDYVCSRCGISEWQGEKLTLHLDHINGMRDDDRLENLRFLCPNCHSLTETYCGRNNKIYPDGKFCKCGKEIYRDSEKCGSCAGKDKPTKITWPKKEELLEMLKKTSFVAIGKQLGVSDNAIRKHLKKRCGINPKDLKSCGT